MPSTTSRRLETRAHLHYGICRRCFGTGTVRDARAAPHMCWVCEGEGALP